MTDFEAILAKLPALTQIEIDRLMQELIRRNEAASDSGPDAGQRGLASWTQSTAIEKWDDVYPDELRSGRKRSA